jgi:hypothetical protein
LSICRIIGPYPVATSQDNQEYYRVNVELQEVLREKNNNNIQNKHFRKLETGFADIPSIPKNDTTKQ